MVHTNFKKKIEQNFKTHSIKEYIINQIRKATWFYVDSPSPLGLHQVLLQGYTNQTNWLKKKIVTHNFHKYTNHSWFSFSISHWDQEFDYS